jgi:hypothetical protein
MAKLTLAQATISNERTYYTGKEILALAKIACTDDTRGTLHCVLVNERGDLIATDGHKAAIVAQPPKANLAPPTSMGRDGMLSPRFNPFLLTAESLKDIRAADLCYLEQDKLVAASSRGNELTIKAEDLDATKYPDIAQVSKVPTGGASFVGLGVPVLKETLALFDAFGVTGIKWLIGEDELSPVHAVAVSYADTLTGGDREVGIQVIAMPVRIDAAACASEIGRDLTDYLARMASAKKDTAAA